MSNPIGWCTHTINPVVGCLNNRPTRDDREEQRLMPFTAALLALILATPAHERVIKPPPLTSPGFTTIDTGRWRFAAARDARGNVIAQGLGTTWNDRVTASGISARPRHVVGCSLPTGRCRATRGTPFPQSPWRTPVTVYSVITGRTISVPLIDEGPGYVACAGTGRRGSAMIDLTRQAWRELGHRPGTHEVRVRVMRP